MSVTQSPSKPGMGIARFRGATRRAPPHAFFLVSAVFHYLGPAFAVLLFSNVDVLGVAWLRIASAAAVFAAWRRPWRLFRALRPAQRWTLIALGAVLAAMNALFYLAIARLPLGTVGAIEFLGPIALAAAGSRTRRNIAALVLAVLGAYLLTDVRIAGEPLGFLFAFANCALFVLYIVLGHAIAQDGGTNGIDRLGAAMLVALVAITPVGIAGALPALTDAKLLAAGIGVGICSSVIPYVCDQLAMARLPRATFALLLSLLPATATLIGLVVLRQLPTSVEIIGIGLVIAGVAIHRERP
jgi:inner membrane transporter RhtA